MRVFPIITAALVVAFLYLLVFERDRVLDFAAGDSGARLDAQIAETGDQSAPETAVSGDGARIVSVVAMKSQARDIASAVLVRGRTEAAR